MGFDTPPFNVHLSIIVIITWLRKWPQSKLTFTGRRFICGPVLAVGVGAITLHLLLVVTLICAAVAKSP